MLKTPVDPCGQNRASNSKCGDYWIGGVAVRGVEDDLRVKHAVDESAGGSDDTGVEEWAHAGAGGRTHRSASLRAVGGGAVDAEVEGGEAAIGAGRTSR
jgi:hypothetical protein